MKKILLIGINARWTHTNPAIRYLRETITNPDYQLEISEYSINQPFLNILADLYWREPDILAFSVYIWNSSILRHILPEIKKVLTAKIILGGPEVSYNAEKWLRDFPEIDFIVKGFGEQGFDFLMKKNFVWKEKVISSKPLSFSKIPFPYNDEEMKNFQKKYIYYEASRGCIFRCSYCLSSREDQALSYKPLKKVKNELNRILQHQPRIVKFIDRSFNSDQKFAREIWKFLMKKNVKTKFHFEIYPSLLEETDLQILATVPEDLFQLEIGVQSTNKKTLRSINRFYEWKNIQKKLQKLTALENIHVHLDFIAGLPFEDMNSARRSISQILSLRPDHFQLGFLKILPGTALAEKQEEYDLRFTAAAPYEILQNKWLDFEDILELKKVENVLNIFYNSGKFVTFLLLFEKFFSNSYKMLKRIADFRESHQIDEQTRDWQQNAAMLVDLIHSDLPEKKDLLKDSLRWDWCKIAKAHYYPKKIFVQSCFEAKKIGYPKLKEKQKQEQLVLTQIKKAIFFKPVSQQFKDKFLPHAEMVAFVLQKEKIRIIFL